MFLKPLFIALTVSTLAAACHKSVAGHDSVTAGTLTISNAYMIAPIGEAPAAMYFTVQNTGATADTLKGVSVAGVAHAELHMEVMSNMPHATQQSMPPMTRMTMVPTPEVPIPAGSVLRLAPNGRHVMLIGVQRRFQSGDSTDAEFTFRYAGKVHITARVIDYSQIDILGR